MFLLFHTLILSLLLVIFVIDGRTKTIPDSLTIPGLLLAFLGSVFLTHSFTSSLLGGAVLAGFFGVQYLLSRGKAVGDGDIVLGGLIGVYLGFPLGLLALWFAYVVGALVLLPRYILHPDKRKETVAFGPFLVLGCFIAFFFGEAVLQLFF